MGFAAVDWSLLAGAKLDNGIEKLVHARWSYDWVGAFLVCSAFLLTGILYATMLVRRASNSVAAEMHL